MEATAATSTDTPIRNYGTPAKSWGRTYKVSNDASLFFNQQYYSFEIKEKSFGQFEWTIEDYHDVASTHPSTASLDSPTFSVDFYSNGEPKVRQLITQSLSK